MEDPDFGGVDGPVVSLACSTGKSGRVEVVGSWRQRRNGSRSHRHHQWKAEDLRDRGSGCRLDQPHRAPLTMRALIECWILFLVQRVVTVMLVSALRFGNVQQLSNLRELLLAVCVCKEPVVANPHKAARQDMHHETSHELIGRKSEPALAVPVAIVLVTERDLTSVD